MTATYLVAGKRTPFGKFGGGLKSLGPVELSVMSAKALLKESSIAAKDIEHVIMGNVIPTTPDTLYLARHLALHIGAEESTPAYSVNRLCGSGIQSIWDACRLVSEGSELVMAGGAENMSMTPHLIYGQRFGQKYGAPEVKDLLLDALTDSYCKTPMGVTAENLAAKHTISRVEADEFAMRSHQYAYDAYKNGKHDDEITPIALKRKTIEIDEHRRDQTTMDEMSKLRPSFQKDGTVTAANASGIVDGAVTTLIASENYCKQHNLKPLAKIVDFSVVGVKPSEMGIGPVPAIAALLKRQNMTLKDIDLFEINEAFAPQALAVQKELEIDVDKLNIWGGAIALGHPLGATGSRITLTLARQLQDQSKKRGIASACIGGGQGIAVMIESC